MATKTPPVCVCVRLGSSVARASEFRAGAVWIYYIEYKACVVARVAQYFLTLKVSELKRRPLMSDDCARCMLAASAANGRSRNQCDKRAGGCARVTQKREASRQRPRRLNKRVNHSDAHPLPTRGPGM